MTGFLALLAVLAQVLVLGAVGCWVVQRASGGSRRPWDALARLVGPDSLKLAWLVAAVATAGSLYMSEVRHFQPCVLCWYQRIAMYPLVFILAVAVLRRDLTARLYVLPLTAVGAATSIYHYQLERFPEQEAIACTSSVPCTTIWFEHLGYITIPMMALSAFALIAVIVTLGGRHGQGIAGEA